MSTSFDELFEKTRGKSVPGSSFDALFEEVEKKQPSKARSLISAPLKGLIKGASKFSPIPGFGPISQEMGERVTEQLLPTREGGLEDVLEFTGENLPFVAAGEGGLARKGLQAVSGALAKKGAKEFDLPEWAQDVIGSVGMASPDIAKGLTKKSLLPSSKQKGMVDYLRSKGLSDQDITPIVQDKKKLSLFSKAARKFEKKAPWLRGIQEKVGGIYEGIRESGKQAGFLDGEPLREFEKAFTEKLDKVPRMYKGLIKKEVEDLMDRPIDFTELHDFKKALNAIVGDVEGGKAAVGILKEPIESAMRKMNPGLYSELKMADKAYSQLMHFSEKMTKKDWDNLLSVGEAGSLLYGALTLNPGALGLVGAELGTRQALRSFLTNPRLQNIHKKIWHQFKKGRMNQALRLSSLLKESIEDQSGSGSPNGTNEPLSEEEFLSSGGSQR